MATDTVIDNPCVIKYNAILPINGSMTITTLLGSGNMRRTLACGNHAIVTARANTQYFSMIHPRGRRPRRGRMAGFTNVSAVDVAG